MICFVFAIILCVSAAPIPYKSFQDYQGTGKLIPVSPHATGFNTTAVPVSRTLEPSFVGKIIEEAISNALKVILSALVSGSCICTCFCTMKYVRNGCVCKKAWFYPKSMAEYRRRKNQTQDHQVYEMQVTTAQPLHSFSSSIASF
ncbi:unnamed protein product [Rotaria magnacalcarata]|uniref:Uncharacterized protein n=1 Tax=Rotaria magnacalcarata TaxID=392030 RepID=A0A816QN88_9BILA|nr:unnamed protein product [Rotaria magnacalcarata]